MSDDAKKYTLRDMVLAQRKAFEDATVRSSGNFAMREFPDMESLKAATKRLYPLPTVTRPRVERDPFSPGMHWKVIKGGTDARCVTDVSGEWETPDGVFVNAERVKLWADLLERPTEQVEDDA